MRIFAAGALLLCACGGGVQHASSSTGADAPPSPPVVVALRFLEAPDEGPQETPRTRVFLVLIDPERGRSTTDVGTYEGACTLADPAEDELLSASCWWGPSGARLGVRRIGRDLVVVRTGTDEGRTGERPAEEVATVSLPEGAQLEVLSGP